MLFPNYFTPPSIRKIPSVTVIHDLQHKHLPVNFSRRKRLWLDSTMKYTLDHADFTIAVSDFVRRDILNQFGPRTEKRVVVIPNALSWQRFHSATDFGPGPPIDSDIETRVLTVASHYPHKNLATLLRAFKIVVAERTAKLVIVGQTSENLVGVRNAFDIEGELRRLQLGDRVEVTGYVSDEQLGQEYKKASLAVFPSLFEGFGIPAVEAMGLGLPVLASGGGAQEEVTLGKAQYLRNPTDHLEMAERIIHMLDNRESFRPSGELMELLRHTYDPRCIGGQYLALMRRAVES
jgi:glycosyltransferase involved in cell wall biosynthesis